MSRSKKQTQAVETDTETAMTAESNALSSSPASQEFPPQTEGEVNEGDVIEPVAFHIVLKAHHPHTDYGRCGYRFNKTEPLEIARADLTDAQIIMLAEDPWLEFVPVTDSSEGWECTLR